MAAENPSPCVVMYLIYLQPQPVPQGAKPLSLQQQRISIISGTRYPQSQILSIMPLMQSQPPQFKSSMMRRYIYQLLLHKQLNIIFLTPSVIFTAQPSLYSMLSIFFALQPFLV